MRLRTHFYRLTFFLLLSYGFFYFSYKWLIPTVVNTDFTMYYGMIQHPLDFHAAPSPWVYRQWTTLIAHMFWRLGFYYADQTQFADPRYDQRIFFAALLTNYVAVVITAWLTTLIVEGWIGKASNLAPVLGGMLCFFSFFLQQTTITGQADGLSWMLLALGYLLYQRRRLSWFAAVVFLSIFQREILPLIFFTFSLVSTFFPRGLPKSDRLFQLKVCILSFAAFCAYLVLRHVIHAPGNEYQTDLHAQFGQLLRFRLTSTYFKQVILGQNLLLILLGLWLLVYKRFREHASRILPMAAVCVVLLLISIMTNIGTNAARMLALLTPVVAAEITLALSSLDSAEGVRRTAVVTYSSHD